MLSRPGRKKTADEIIIVEPSAVCSHDVGSLDSLSRRPAV
jgi:hypothetical protein